jgi:arsenate reductase
MITVLFACMHNAGRSQIAAALFNRSADPTKAHAISAGTTPADRVHPEVVTVMKGRGIDLSTAVPRKLTPDLAATAQWLITMGCGDECPVVPGTVRDDWPLADPRGLGPNAVGAIVADIEARVTALLDEQGWAAPQRRA